MSQRRGIAHFSPATFDNNPGFDSDLVLGSLGADRTCQTVASIPAKDGELLVQNGANNDVWLVAANERVSVNAEEALRVAGWIKEGKIGKYGDTGSVRFRRESRILVVTFAPDQAGKKELRLKEAEALAARRRAGLGAPERQRSWAMNWRQP